MLIGALAPIVVSLGLGFLAGWRHDFNSDQAAILNRMVMNYALPLSLFAGVMAVPRARLFSNLPMLAWIAGAMGGGLVVVYLISRYLARRPAPVAALQALAISCPAVPFVGSSVLPDLFKTDAALAIAIGSLVVNLVQVPFVMLVLTRAAGAAQPGGVRAVPAKVASAGASSAKDTGVGTGAQAKAGGGGSVAVATASAKNQTVAPSPLRSVLANLRGTVVQPVVWAPLAAFALVVLGVRLPTAAHSALMLLGGATSGVALFASGATL
ncbi:MAG: AEC family transporter, partial [Bifidobacteriaceae bacterium]|nr:AEC family transporter [Bifidobacteriaceae bacterium]